jgi:4-hydroxy-4-methyl-2-oxoglutarate aldolase
MSRAIATSEEIEMEPDLPASLVESLRDIGPATLHEAQGQYGAVDPAIKPLDPTMRLAGPALTVDCRPSDNLMLHLAIARARRGEVLVVDAKAFVDAGAWGDVMTLAAQTRGIAGLVIDGAVRDANSIVAMGFPVFSRGICIRGTIKNQPGRLREPIVLGGTLVNDGDIIVGDRDGLVIIPRARAAEVARLGREREAKEEALRNEIRSGRTTVELLGLHETLTRLGLS